MSIICISFICFLLFFTSPLSSSTTDDEDALLKIKKQLGDPEILRSWVKGFNFFNFSIQLPSGEGDDNIYILCTDTSRVSSFVIQYLDNEIVAPFPDAVCDLTELEELIIAMVPGLYGSVPSCVTELWKLRSFVITYTSVSGPVPDFYIHTKINKIDLERNHLSGTIPTSLSSLPNLQQLDLSYNNLTGPIPQGLRSRSLDLSFNNLTGEIPKCYQWMDFLDFNVYRNNLTGDASFLFGKQKSTETINLGYNNFEFDLSDIEFSDNLTCLDLSHNRIYGNVSDSIAHILYGEPERYMYLNLSNNELCGELPQPPDSNHTYWRYGFDVFENNSCLCGYPLLPCSGNWSPLPSWSPAPSPVSEPPF